MSKATPIIVTVRKVWRALVPTSMRKYGRGAAIALAQRHVNAALAHGEPSPSLGPLIVSGLTSGTKGVSRAARLTVEGLRAAGYLPVTHDIASVFSATDASDIAFPVTSGGGVWILHVNAPEAIAALARVSKADWLGRYRIAYWAYELPRVPAQWVRAANAFHEIWVPSRFVADALVDSGVKRPVRVMPHPVMLDAPLLAPNLAGDDFVVLAMGDLKSSAARKNLIGAIDIYKRAFPKEAPTTRLILKVQSEGAHPEFRDAALTAVADRGDIMLRTGSLNDTEIAQLIASASVFLSPHRSEGFGLVIAESFLAGVPSLATGWSGNMDFMDSLPELLISHTLVPVLDPARIYRASGQRWAEPDLDDAARKLKALAASPHLRRELAMRGRAAVEAQAKAWSREAFADTAIARLASQP